MVPADHVHFYKEIFALPGVLRGPVLCFGFQEFAKGASLDGKQYVHLGEYFATLGIRAASLDLFNSRSELRYDMNYEVPEIERGRYSTLIDIGSLEHVFDTRQCIENCLRMLTLGGHYLLHTAVNGHFGHGFHVFNPECLRSVLRLNGFRIIYEKYSTIDGRTLVDPSLPGDTLTWIAARKDREIAQFVCPQQQKWYTRYA